MTTIRIVGANAFTADAGAPWVIPTGTVAAALSPVAAWLAPGGA